MIIVLLHAQTVSGLAGVVRPASKTQILKWASLCQRNLECSWGHLWRVIRLALPANRSLGHVVFRGLVPEGPLEVDSILKPLSTVFEIPPSLGALKFQREFRSMSR